MACEEVDLGEYVVGDILTFGFDFFDYDDNDVLIGPSNLIGHTFRSQIRYVPEDPLFYEWGITVTGNRVEGLIVPSVSRTIPTGLLWWDMEDNGVTIMGGRVRFKPDVTR